jgi:hypothetical protein
VHQRRRKHHRLHDLLHRPSRAPVPSSSPGASAAGNTAASTMPAPSSSPCASPVHPSRRPRHMTAPLSASYLGYWAGVEGVVQRRCRTYIEIYSHRTPTAVKGLGIRFELSSTPVCFSFLALCNCSRDALMVFDEMSLKPLQPYLIAVANLI